MKISQKNAMQQVVNVWFAGCSHLFLGWIQPLLMKETAHATAKQQRDSLVESSLHRPIVLFPCEGQAS